jgi:hypothetical protein
MAQREVSSNRVGYLFRFQNNHPDRKFSSMTNQRACRCGNAFLCLRNCRGFEVWMSGLRNHLSLERSFVLTSSRNFSVGVTVFGFTIMGNLRTLQGGTICFYNGLKLISDIHHTLLSKETSFFTWLLARLILVASASFILSVVVLATLIFVPLYLLTKLRRLKTSFLGYSQRLVKTLRRIFS